MPGLLALPLFRAAVSHNLIVRKTYLLFGIVQGVGFRPAVHRLACKLGLGGLVQNLSGSVQLELDGSEWLIDEFFHQLPSHLPEAARIEGIKLISTASIEKTDIRPFSIAQSLSSQKPAIAFPADLAICKDCLSEITSPADRRYGYSFTTCTNCGPRFTVINGTPYDRERTTLAPFNLCSECRCEYEDPTSRRFHAESIACSKCGPSLFYADERLKILTCDELLHARREIAQGKIIALRGIGGYLLAADAFNREAIIRLREKKNRPHKPLAIMAANLGLIGEYCELSEEAAKALASAEAPIVVLPVRTGLCPNLPLDLISPDTRTIGIMLPNSPLHSLLFQPLAADDIPPFKFLVMTSGNRRGEPICISNQEAFERLQGIAEGFVAHNREINLRADDSVCAPQGTKMQIWRRARGYAPSAIKLKHPLKRCVLALGAEQKNSIAVGDLSAIIPSAHIGDLDTPEALLALENAVNDFPRFLRLTPEIVAVDLHPDMNSSLLGRRIAAKQGLELVALQHHYAHAASCMAEHGLSECLALTFDGTGLGTDGSIWGGELLHARREGFHRLASFSPVPLPGGDVAVRQPVRQAVARLFDAGIEISPRLSKRLGLKDEELEVWQRQAASQVNSPLSSAAGRLFDSFAVLLAAAAGSSTYDGQAAIKLESCAKLSKGSAPELKFAAIEENGILRINWRPAFCQLMEDKDPWNRAEQWALALHLAVAKAAAVMVEYGAQKSRLTAVALTGGVFMNQLLTELLTEDLRQRGMEVFIHLQVPPNDGGISVGQAYVAGTQGE